MIVNRAATLFDERGYHSTGVEDIAEAVGIRKPTLYHYVRSKNEILLWIHEEFLSVLTTRLERRAALELGPSQQLLEVMADILELMDTHRGHVRVFFEHHRELPEKQREEIRSKRDHYQSAVEEIIHTGVEAGEFRPVDVRVTTLALFGMCNWAYQWYRKDGPLRSREIAYLFWDIFVTGLRALPCTAQEAGGLITESAAS